jgi:hypothetical protein
MPRFVQRCVQPSAHNHILPQRAGRAQAPDRRTQNSRAGADCEENASDAQAHDAEPAGGPLTAADQTPMDIIGRIRSRVQARPQKAAGANRNAARPSPLSRQAPAGGTFPLSRQTPAGGTFPLSRQAPAGGTFPLSRQAQAGGMRRRPTPLQAPGLAPGAGWVKGSRPGRAGFMRCRAAIAISPLSRQAPAGGMRRRPAPLRPPGSRPGLGG